MAHAFAEPVPAGMDHLESYDAIVLGAGLSGLTAADGLRRKGCRVLVLEQKDRAGGVIRSERRDGYLCEWGPTSFLLKTREVEDYMAALGLGSALVPFNPQAKHRFIVRGGRPRALPKSLAQAASSPILSLRAKWAVLREPSRERAHDEDESVACFVRRRLGQEFLDYMIAPMVSGIFAGDPERLSVRYAFPKVWDLEARHGSLIRGTLSLRRAARRSSGETFRSRLVSFGDGLEAIPARQAEALGEQLLTGVELLSLEQQPGDKQWLVEWRRPDTGRKAVRCKRLIVTVPTHAWLRLPFSREVRMNFAALAPVVHPPVAHLALGFRREQIAHALDGFGMLIPAVEKQPILGTIFASSLFPDRAPDGRVLLVNFLGGVTDPDAGRLPEGEAVDAALRALRALLGVRGGPDFVHHVRWERAIPQYHVGYGRFLEGLAQIEAGFGGLHVQGSFRGGPGLSDVMANALALADRIAGEVAGDSAEPADRQ